MQQSPKGRLIVLSGPSGVGKTTLRAEVLKHVPARLSVSATTRSPRGNETNGVDYLFVSRETFAGMLAAGEFLEHAMVFGNNYGTPVTPVRQALARGQNVLLEIDVQGGVQVRHLFPDAIMIFLLPPSLDKWRELLRRRLVGRGMDQPQEIERRLCAAAGEIEQARLSGVYAHFVTNDDLEAAGRQLVEIIRKELEKP